MGVVYVLLLLGSVPDGLTCLNIHISLLPDSRHNVTCTPDTTAPNGLAFMLLCYDGLYPQTERQNQLFLPRIAIAGYATQQQGKQLIQLVIFGACYGEEKLIHA